MASETKPPSRFRTHRRELVPTCPGVIGESMATEPQGSVLHPPPQARRVVAQRTAGPPSACPLPHAEDCVLVTERHCVGQGQLRPAQQLPGETSAVGLEPPEPWTVPENPRAWLWAGRGQASPGPAPRHWSAPWSRRSWGPLPSEASAHRPFCSRSPTSPGSARERPREWGPRQRRRRAFTTGSGAENPGQDWKAARPWMP